MSAYHNGELISVELTAQERAVLKACYAEGMFNMRDYWWIILAIKKMREL